MTNPFNKELRTALEEVLNVSDYDTETEKIAKQALANTTKADENWEAVKRLIKASFDNKEEFNADCGDWKTYCPEDEVFKALEALPDELVTAVMEDDSLTKEETE